MKLPLKKRSICSSQANLSQTSGFQPMGLVERIQAIAQNVSEMAVRMEQILQKSKNAATGRDGMAGQCEIPKDPGYPDCASKVDWMRARWTSDPCYAFYGVDGSDCSFLIYLSEVEWFCPLLAWRNQSIQPTTSTTPKTQAIVRADMGPLLEQVGSGKESLSFMKSRIRRLAVQWAVAARRLDEHLRSQQRHQKRVSLRIHTYQRRSTTSDDSMGHYVSPSPALSIKDCIFHMSKIWDVYLKVCIKVQNTGQHLLK
ncbi:hypothetical protein PDJAM_G00046930 [Pangasius djambal]|uniref:Uncharacterized protein n=1 Tax=Pangasius djambal TaxID=1691987 RepID=A0ACC5YUU8_9TELE|nr:hypothetical protein [Pangasius djambal]